MKLNKHQKTLLIIISGVMALATFLYWQNNGITITNIIYINPKIPDKFEGYVITQVSDLHSKEFGKDNKHLINAIAKTTPNIIVVTGDLVGGSNETALEFIRRATQIAPVYFVSGNHDISSGIYEELKQLLLDAGAIILDNEKLTLSFKGASINLLGLADPESISDFMTPETCRKIDEQLDALMEKSTNSFNILFSHRPELFDMYVNKNCDLVFTGHAHGGQIRLPFIGGLFAPDQGWFPVYTSGSYEKAVTTMVVSRGVGNSVIHQRLFNLPEIIAVTLKCKTDN